MVRKSNTGSTVGMEYFSTKTGGQYTFQQLQLFLVWQAKIVFPALNVLDCNSHLFSQFTLNQPFLITAQLDAVSKRFNDRWKHFSAVTLDSDMLTRCRNRALCNTQQRYSPPRRGNRSVARPCLHPLPAKRTGASGNPARSANGVVGVCLYIIARAIERSGLGPIRNGADYFKLSQGLAFAMLCRVSKGIT